MKLINLATLELLTDLNVPVVDTRVMKVFTEDENGNPLTYEIKLWTPEMLQNYFNPSDLPV